MGHFQGMPTLRPSAETPTTGPRDNWREPLLRVGRFAAGRRDADFANRILNYGIRSLSVLLHFKAENRALRPLRVADRDFRVPRIRDAHRPQWNAHVEEVFSGLNQRIGM